MEEDILDDLFRDQKKRLNPRQFNILRFLIFLLVLVAGISTGYAWSDIKTIMDSGPIGSAMGFIVLIYAGYVKEKTGIFLGLSAPLVSLVCLLLIYLLHWSQQQAELPIASILTAYTLVLFGIFILKFIRKQP